MRRILAYTLALLSAASPVFGDEETIGPKGIRSAGLTFPNGDPLTGAGVGIGQVEPFRPGKSVANGGNDDPSNSGTLTIPEAVYRRTSNAPGNTYTSEHAQQVASIMISKSATYPGVAKNAKLYSSAADSTDQIDFALTSQFIANRNSEDIRAINMSFGLPLVGFETTDGNSHLSAFVDWSSTRHNTLYVIAGTETIGGAGPVPTDSYNGLTVGYSAQSSLGSQYDYVGFFNRFDEDAIGDRVSVDLIAPGEEIDVLGFNDAHLDHQTGTSLAAPHVTGTVALLQEYANFKVNEGTDPRWNDNAKQHEVMKAVLLNSADKLNGVHGSTRTILNDLTGGVPWNQTSAYFSSDVSLDERMGAGHLNAESAMQNFKIGEYDPGTVEMIGWDYGTMGTTGDFTDYYLGSGLGPNAWYAMTLAWDRRVELTSLDDDYQFGDQFFTNQINNLDLYLMPANSNDHEIDAIDLSIAVDDNVEHIFAQIPSGGGGEYKIRVVHNGGLGDEQNYALAW